MSAKIYQLFTIMGKHKSTSERPNRVHELRKARGWTQDELGERVGLSGEMIGLLENGKRNLSHQHMRAIARALGTAADELLNPEDRSIVLTRDEEALLADYRAADERGRYAVRSVATAQRSYTPEPADEDEPNGHPVKRSA